MFKNKFFTIIVEIKLYLFYKNVFLYQLLVYFLLKTQAQNTIFAKKDVVKLMEKNQIIASLNFIT